MKYGLIFDAIRDAHEYIVGSSRVPYVRFNEEGDWRVHAPTYESQSTKIGEETHGCTLWGAQNQIETLEHFLYQVDNNYSEAFNYPRIPIRPEIGGADPHTTYEAIRRDGLVREKEYQMPDSLQDLRDISRQSKSLEARGQNWLYRNDFKHESLWPLHARPTNYKEILRDSLTTSPLGISVDAWIESNGVYVSDQNGKNTHWCVLLYIGDYLSYKAAYCVFDTYDHSTKWLHPDHDIRFAKRIWLQKKTRRGMKTMIELLTEIIQKLTMKPTLVDVCMKYLGKDASPLQLTDSEVACAETVSYLIKQVYPEVPVITGTATLYEWLEAEPAWKSVKDPEPGDIIISPTGYGNNTIKGHAGIMLNNGLIASNNSYGTFKGKFTQNFTMESWKNRYVTRGGFPVYIFRHA